MKTLDLAARRADIIKQYGQWTDHNVQLAEGIYTIDPNWVSEKLRRVVQIVTDWAGGSVENLRVLDLACLEGQYAVEFALKGAEVVGIEGREANIQKARFAQEALGLKRLTFVQDDVRNLSPEKYGEFDVVLCLGILYHLDAPDVFQFVERIGSVCRKIAVIDTFVGVKDLAPQNYRNHRYGGRFMHEHKPTASVEERLQDKWASLDNPRSFWITRPSLYNLITVSGFTSAYDCQMPFEVHKPSDRLTVVAVKGRPATVAVTPKLNSTPVPEWPEGFMPDVSYQQRRSTEFAKAVSKLVPAPLKKSLKYAKAVLTGQKGRDYQTWHKGQRG